MDKRLTLKLNAGRTVSGILRGFDPFMNVVIDDSIEECKDGTKNNVGMVVSILKKLFEVKFCLHFFLKFISKGNQRKQYCDG